MMDNNELKRLAEAASPGPWLQENDDLYFKDDGYTRHMLTADAGQDVCDEDGNEDIHRDNLKFIAAANPAAVLALIAENERLKREEKNDAIAYKAVIERQKELRIERDQFKSDLHYTQKALDEAMTAVERLRDENERVKARLCVCRDCQGQGEVYSGHDTYQGHFQPPEPDMDMCGTCGGDGVLGPIEDFEALVAERDRMRDLLKEISQSSGDNWAVMQARNILNGAAE